MAVGRSKCSRTGIANIKPLSHDEFIRRVKKTLYYGETEYEEIAVSHPLAEYASELFSEPHKGQSLNRLTRATAGKLQANPCSLIMALIYLERLSLSDPNYVRRVSPTELFIISMMISTKIYCGNDEEFYLEDWIDGNMTEEQFKKQELEFLCAIDWNIYISKEIFFEKLRLVEKTIAHKEGTRRGWFTYTELKFFLPSITLAKFIVSNIAVITFSYVTGLVTIVGAFVLTTYVPGNILVKLNENHNSVSTLSEISTKNSTINTNSSTKIISDTIQINVDKDLENIETKLKCEENSRYLKEKSETVNENLYTSRLEIFSIKDWTKYINDMMFVSNNSDFSKTIYIDLAKNIWFKRSFFWLKYI